jgi:hypothetical protein
MNPYAMLGSGLGTNEAASLNARLSAWHDAMVAHERRLRTGRTNDGCNDECPHAEARALWSEAVATLGARAYELTFLRSRANESTRRLRTGAEREAHSEASERTSSRSETPRNVATAASGAARLATEL